MRKFWSYQLQKNDFFWNSKNHIKIDFFSKFGFFCFFSMFCFGMFVGYILHWMTSKYSKYVFQHVLKLATSKFLFFESKTWNQKTCIFTKKWSKMKKMLDFWNFQRLILRPEIDKLGRFCCQMFWNEVYFSQNFFHVIRTKIHYFKSKKLN